MTGLEIWHGFCIKNGQEPDNENRRQTMKRRNMAALIALLAASITLAGCAIPLEKRVITPSEFISGRLVTLTGEVTADYKDTNLRSDLNLPLVVYNSVDESGNNIMVNVHEDFRFGLNAQAIKRIKEAINKENCAIRVYGRTTYDNMIYDIDGLKKEVRNVDADLITLTEQTGKLILTLETDLDPIVTLMDPRTIMMPINVNPGISWGLNWPWNFGYGSMFRSLDWFAQISVWGYFGPCMSGWYGAMGQDWDGDGIPNYIDPYPYDPTNSGLNGIPSYPGSSVGYFNPYAGLNLHNYIAAMKGDSKMMIPEEGARLHPDFVNIFARNRQADEYRAQISVKRQALINEYNSKPATARIRNAEPIFSTENIAKSAGIRMSQLQKAYNNPQVRMPGLIFERGYGLSNQGAGARQGGGGNVGGYAIPSAGSGSASDAASSGSSGSSSGGHIKNNPEKH
jgi:hypothetical protein